MLNIRLFIVLACLSLVSLNLKAQKPVENVLWEISGNDLQKPSYMYATINFLPDDKYNVPKEVKLKIKACEIFATKILYNNAAKKEFNKAVRIPKNGWINDYLTDDELNTLRLMLLKDFEIKENQYYDFYSRLQPIILVTSTTALYLDDNIVFVEDELADLAKKNKMNFVGLGTIQEEIEAFEQFPIEDQVEALKFTINNFNQHIKDYEDLVAYYNNEENLNKVKEETLKATNESKRFKKVYYDDRVKNWIPKIMGLMNQEPTFLAIGAPYLVGETGLIELLKEAGYTLTPIDIK